MNVKLRLQRDCWWENTLSWSSLAMPILFKNVQTLLRWSPCSWMISPYSGCSTTVPLQAKSFLKARTSFFLSNSSLMPCTVVKVLRPLRCWIRMWMRPVPRFRSVVPRSLKPPVASLNGSNHKTNQKINIRPLPLTH